MQYLELMPMAHLPDESSQSLKVSYHSGIDVVEGCKYKIKITAFYSLNKQCQK
jgi:hypothetical protein